MIFFVVLAALALALVLVLLMRPFIFKRSDEDVSHRQLNMAILRDQFARLDADLADQLISQADYEQARAELNRRVLEEAGQIDAKITLRTPRRTMVAVSLGVVVAAVALYLLLGNFRALDGASAPVHEADAQRMQLEAMVEGLAHKLEQEPGNREGWVMLARSYRYLGRMMEAEVAFERAGSFLDKDAQALAAYADTAAANAGGRFEGKPMQLIARALKADPNNGMALWLAGTAAFRNADYGKAIKQWERLHKLLPPGSEDARTLSDAIDEAYAKAGKTRAQSRTAEPTAPAAGARVSGVVEVAAALQSKATPQDTLLIIARMPGMRMPVAVLRTSAAQLPLKFTLDDSLSMSPQARLSMAAEVEIEARISKSGMAQAEAGDLISAVQKVKVGAQNIRLKVDQVRP